MYSSIKPSIHISYDCEIVYRPYHILATNFNKILPHLPDSSPPAVFNMPQSSHEWSQFVLSEEAVVVFLAKSKRSNRMLNADTIQDPMMLLHFCKVLTEHLIEMEYHSFCFPIYSATFLLAKSMNSSIK